MRFWDRLLVAWRTNGDKLAFLLLCWLLAITGLWVALYQLEIVYILLAMDASCYYFPFLIAGCVPLWWARDFWYFIIIGSFLVTTFGTFVAIWFWD